MASQINSSTFIRRMLRASTSPSVDVCQWNRCPLAVLLPLLVVLGTMGCQGENSAPVPSDPAMMRGVIATYRTATSTLGKPPASMDDLKQVLAPLLDDPSQLLRSKRDGQDFVIVWGLNLGNTPADVVVAYEQTGLDGKRMIVTAAGDVREVSAEEFATLKFPKNHQPNG